MALALALALAWSRASPAPVEALASDEALTSGIPSLDDDDDDDAPYPSEEAADVAGGLA